MIRALVVYCHPRHESFTHAVKELVLEKLEKAGADHRLIDLYAEGFQPAMTREDWERYEDVDRNRGGYEAHCEALEWCNTLIFVYPTWWYGLPAMLKGWLDRVLVPGLAFHMPPPEGGDIKPGLTHITRLGVFTTCGASWWLTRYVSAPGKRTLLRGVNLLTAKGAKTVFAAHYLMDSSTDASRRKHLARVDQKLTKFLKG